MDTQKRNREEDEAKLFAQLKSIPPNEIEGVIKFLNYIYIYLIFILNY